MLQAINELFSTVINNDYCVGCGNCASIKDSPFKMVMNGNGKYAPVIDNKVSNNEEKNILEICPFSNMSKDEDIIAKQLYGSIDGIYHNEYIGYYIKNYAGYVKKGEYRERGSSGGMGTWIATQLLELNLIDAIIHVKASDKDKGTILFTYQISSNAKELSEGSKSKYYPIEMSQVIKFVRNNPGRYALIGIPCFIKAIRLLAEKDNQVNERIRFTIGLVCGHLKTDMFVKSMAWQMGIRPEHLADFDFRMKLDDRGANSYGVKAKGIDNGKAIIQSSPVNKLYTTNWGQGFFKYKSCDFCDDILAETADITIGDAWLPEYVMDSKGTNIVVVRNPIMQNIIEENMNELQLDELSAEKIFASQAGGFRHRREGLSYRLYLKDQNNEWRPIKRIKASNNISSKRKKIYEQRVILYEESYKAFKKAEEKEDFNEFIKQMDPLIKNYNKLNAQPFFLRLLRKIKSAFSY